MMLCRTQAGSIFPVTAMATVTAWAAEVDQGIGVDDAAMANVIAGTWIAIVRTASVTVSPITRICKAIIDIRVQTATTISI
ncbi:hypothetical protein Fuma_00346 [Fuerstiella marisgermanici]|uniref:Secreted protein n=1 Tax=Fuerstiella marisgermanici TaxID=1891926 RepID=A0A1P8W9N9_9PLAN|nr:hypothetical protein Fuma_00346 [Fuerstiella marisgermanici]